MAGLRLPRSPWTSKKYEPRLWHHICTHPQRGIGSCSLEGRLGARCSLHVSIDWKVADAWLSFSSKAEGMTKTFSVWSWVGPFHSFREDRSERGSNERLIRAPFGSICGVSPCLSFNQHRARARTWMFYDTTQGADTHEVVFVSLLDRRRLLALLVFFPGC